MRYKVTLTDGKTVIGAVAVVADSPRAAMTLAEDANPRFAAYDVERHSAFDYSTVGGLFGK